MKKYTPDYESGLMEIDDKYGEYVLASEYDTEISELVEMLENVLEGQSHDYPRTYLNLEIKELINKHKKRKDDIKQYEGPNSFLDDAYVLTNGHDAEVSKLLRIIYRQYEELDRYDDEVEEVIDKYKKEG